MPAISLLGIVLFVLQAGVGYHLYRSLSSSGNGSGMLIGAMVTGVGIASLFIFGMIPTLALDFVLLLISALVSRQSNNSTS